MADSFHHIFLQNSEFVTRYVPRSRPGGKPSYKSRNRRSHSERLHSRLDAIWLQTTDEREERKAVGLSVRTGTYLEFESAEGFDLAINSLENRQQGIRLANVRQFSKPDGSQDRIFATVYVPSGKENYFLTKIEDYANENKDNEKGNPKNQKLVASIEDIRLAVIEPFWQDDPSLKPREDAKWCEVWLRSSDERDVVQLFQELAKELGIPVQQDVLIFPERFVLLALLNLTQLGELVAVCDDIAEFRIAKETVRFFLELDNEDQTEWVTELSERVSCDNNALVAVTILDSGVNNGHLLLRQILADTDRQAVKDDWGTTDHDGHGTNMAGIAAFGDLQQALMKSNKIYIPHCLESVKILPSQGTNDPSLYGHITIQAVSLAEIQAPQRTHIPCMAVTAPDYYGRGRPSSWSAAIDQLTSGHDNDSRYLFLVSAGNVRDPNDWVNYPNSNLTAPIHDPAQSWNAVAVGAYTSKDRITAPSLRGYSPTAKKGSLSPFSSTSLTWDTQKWPLKPDIVMEGGNTATSPDRTLVEDCPDLALVTTGHQPLQRQLDLFNMTSAATAKAGWLAAQIQTVYPNAWPETIRGLMVHSAEWTESMKQDFLDGNSKTDYIKLLRFCGYGVPSLDRAINCYRNSLTLIAECEFQPFEKNPNGSGVRMKEMHFHELPWPKDILIDLGETPVTLRATLSYFIEPSPGEIGWQDRYRYASHTLRFDINDSNENREEFRARLNKAAREEGTDYPSKGDSGWQIGVNGRHKGSLHSDLWNGTAADLATRNHIGVYPVGGWWKERYWLGRAERLARYSLIVTITTPIENVDIYTPIAAIVNTPITIEID